MWLFCEVDLFCTILSMKVCTESERMLIAMWQLYFFVSQLWAILFLSFFLSQEKKSIGEDPFFSLYESILVFCQTFCGTELESRTEEGKCSSLTSILKLYYYFDIEGNIKNSQKLFSFLLYYAELEECINFLAFPLDLTLFLISPAPEQKQKQL